MKTQARGAAARRLRSITNVAAAFALAAFIAPFFLGLNLIWAPSKYGDYGLSVDAILWVVQGVTPGSVADEAGIKTGDRVDRPQTLRDRLLVSGASAPHPGERMMLSIWSGSKARMLTLEARPISPLSMMDKAILGLQGVVALVFLLVGLVLVLLRPSKMTWGFYFFAIWIPILLLSDANLSLPTDWFFARSAAVSVLTSACAVGFLVFCLRFPANQPTGWLRTLDKATPYLFFVLTAVALPLPGLIFPTPPGWHDTSYLWLEGVLGIAVVGVIVLLMTFVGARGLERQRIKWVVLGLVWAVAALLPIALIPLVPAISGWLPGSPYASSGIPYISPFNLLLLVLPLTVAYAVIRHRVIDIRFVGSRSLALGVMVSIIAFMVLGIDWLFSARLPNSRLEAAAYVLVILFVGFSLNAARQTIGNTVDYLFFRPWYRTRKQAGTISDCVRRATSKDDLYRPLSEGLAGAFSLASAALFERVEGAGFVRVAARGWPAGTIWHILVDDPLLRHAGASVRVVDIDGLEWRERALPTGVARPIVMLPIVLGGRSPAMLLCGAHENGTGLDWDEIRAIRRLCADAGPVYDRSPDFLDSNFPGPADPRPTRKSA